MNLTYEHEGQVGPSPITALHIARKARLSRFEEAAKRHQDKGRQEADIQQCDILENTVLSKPSRRNYETSSSYANLPITRRILVAASDEFGMAVSEIISRSHEAKYCLPRFVAVGLFLELTRMSLPAIGRALGGRDHTTVINGRSRIYGLLQDEAFRNRFDEIKAAVSA